MDDCFEEGTRDMITEEDVYMWGFERGEVKGRFDTLVSAVRGVMANLHITLEAALDACGLTGTERAQVAAAVEQR